MNKKTGFSLWPKLEDENSAILAARQGFYATIFCAVVTAALALMGGFGSQIMGFGLWNLIDVGILAALAFGIHRMSRTAAVIAFLYYIACRIDLWSRYGAQSPLIAGLFVLMFLAAIRGTFAYHSFRATVRPEAPVLGSAPMSDHFSIERAG